jgi:tetratricopeptide (TPR) repeat protein
MNHRRRSSRLALWMAAAAVSGLGWAMPGSAWGQYRVENYEGHLLDASNRIGSGGYNNSGSPTNNVNAEELYLGNVTGYGAFKGNVPDLGQGAWTGSAPYQPSLILQQQSGMQSPTGPPTYNKPQPYFNQYTIGNAPQGFQFQQSPFSNSYFSAPAPTQQANDYRLGATLNVPSATLPGPGEIVGPGQVNLAAPMTPSFLTNAPIAAVNSSSPAISGQVGAATMVQTQASGMSSGLTQADILRLRGEMNNGSLSASAAAELQNTSSNANTNTAGALLPAGLVQNEPLSGAISGTQSLSPVNLAAQATLASVQISPGVGNLLTGQTERSFIPLPAPPSEQSPQYARLKALWDQYQSSQPKSDEDANRLYRAALQARQAYEQALTRTPAPAPTPSPTEVPTQNNTAQPSDNSNPTTPETPATPPPAPLQIGSIGASIRASGLSQLVQQGETLSRQQRFRDAVGKFMDARQVAPNNMLIAVDLANAELGAGFYTDAEQSLRDAFSTDPALLMGQYDLKSTIGDDRLQFVMADLKHLSTSGESSTPAFLLAYISYNTGQTDQAVEYLKLAQTRAGGQDDVIHSLTEHWSLPTTQPSK